MHNSKWRRSDGGRIARSICLTVTVAVMVVAAGGAMRLIAPPTEETDATAAVQPLIALEEEAHLLSRPLPQVPALADAPGEPADEPEAETPAVEPGQVEASLAPPTTDPSTAPAAEPEIPFAGAALPEDELPTFNGRPIRPVQTITMLVTAYSPDAASCAPFDDGITASGYSVATNGGNLVAADTDMLPLGTVVTVPGYNDGLPVPVLDRGGAIKGKRLDLLYPTHEAALQWGVKKLDVVVWDYADGE